MKRNKFEAMPFEKVLESHKRMLYRIIYKNYLSYGTFKIDIDDLYQEASLGLFLAYQQYHEESEAKFSSYAYVIVERRIKRKIQEYLKPYLNEPYSIDEYNGADYSDSYSNSVVNEDPMEYHSRQEIYKSIDDYLETLDETKREIFRLRSEGLTYKAISDKLGISTKKVDNDLRRIREGLKKYLKK